MSSEEYRQMIAARIMSGVSRAEKAERNPEDQLARDAIQKEWNRRTKEDATPPEEIQKAQSDVWQKALLLTPEDPQPYRIYGPGR